MTVNSINTNIAAYFAQQNIGNASASTALSVARLSSGNRIVRAADDVAGLAIGTSLAIGVQVFKTALISAAQGNSLLQVADGALAQITDIVKRQKTIAAQAGSGSLSDTERGFLNQEFQALASEIDRISSKTTFSGVNLIDGSISGSTGFSTNDADSDAAALASSSFVTFTASLASAGDTITVAGVKFTFAVSQPGQVAAVGKITVGDTAANTALNTAAALNKAAATDGRLANLFFVASGATVIAHWTGGDGVGSVTTTVTSSFTCTNNTTADATINISAGTNGLGIDRTSLVGTLTGSIFASGGSATHQSGQAINLSSVEDNADFVGKFGQGKVGLFTGHYTATDTATFSIKVGDITYATAATDITNAAGTATTLTFVGSDQFGTLKGGQFTMKIDGSTITGNSVTGQAVVDGITDQINNGISGLSIQQNRDVLGVANVGSVTSGGVQVGDTTGFQFDFRTSNFTNANISSLTVTALGAGGTDAVFEAVINGELYRSVAGIGNQIGKNTVIALQNVNDSSKVFSITTGNTGLLDATSTTLDLSTQTKASAVQAALTSSLGIGTGGDGLKFQVGATSSDSLNVTIGNASTASLYGGKTLSVDTQVNAAAASVALDGAVKAITNLRAGVGALQSRFGFASNNLQIVIQNQDAARAELLDTDIASESTLYATYQVKIQAGIATLAQSNQQLQSLLKLIG